MSRTIHFDIDILDRRNSPLMLSTVEERQEMLPVLRKRRFLAT